MLPILRSVVVVALFIDCFSSGSVHDFIFDFLDERTNGTGNVPALRNAARLDALQGLLSSRFESVVRAAPRILPASPPIPTSIFLERTSTITGDATEVSHVRAALDAAPNCLLPFLSSSAVPAGTPLGLQFVLPAAPSTLRACLASMARDPDLPTPDPGPAPRIDLSRCPASTLLPRMFRAGVRRALVAEADALDATLVGERGGVVGARMGVQESCRDPGAACSKLHLPVVILPRQQGDAAEDAWDVLAAVNASSYSCKFSGTKDGAAAVPGYLPETYASSCFWPGDVALTLGFRGSPGNNAAWLVRQATLLSESQLAMLRESVATAGGLAILEGVDRLLFAQTSATDHSILGILLEDLPAGTAALGEGRSVRTAAEYAEAGAAIVLGDGTIIGPASPALPIIVRPAPSHDLNMTASTAGTLLVLVPEALWGSGSPRSTLATLTGFRWKGNAGVFVVQEVIHGEAMELRHPLVGSGSAGIRSSIPAVALRLVAPSDCRGGNAGWLSPEINTGGAVLHLAGAVASRPATAGATVSVAPVLPEERWMEELSSGPGRAFAVLGSSPAAAFGAPSSSVPLGLVFIAPEMVERRHTTLTLNASDLRTRFLELRAVRFGGLAQPGNAGSFGVFGSRGSVLLLGDALSIQGAAADGTGDAAGAPSCLAALTSSDVVALSRVVDAAAAGSARAASDWTRISGVLAPNQAVVVPPVCPASGGILVVLQGPEIVHALAGVCARTPGCDWTAAAVADSSAGAGKAAAPLRASVSVAFGGRACERAVLLHLSAVVCIAPAGPIRGGRVDADIWLSPPPASGVQSNRSDARVARIHVHLPLAIAYAAAGVWTAEQRGSGSNAAPVSSASWGPGSPPPESLALNIDTALARAEKEREDVRDGLQCGICSTHGVCTQVDVDSAGAPVRVCVCDVGWAGASCQQSFLPCPGGNDCSFHGTCDGLNGRCVCEQGWTGPACDVPAANDSAARTPQPGAVHCTPTCCEGGGTCDALMGRCICEPGRAGPGCCDDVCAPHGSFSRTSGACDALPGWHAPRPGEPCAVVGVAGCRPSILCIADRSARDTCHRHATACSSAGACECEPGFGGPACEGVTVRVGDVTRHHPRRLGRTRRHCDASLTATERAAFLALAAALDPGVGGASVALGHVAAALAAAPPPPLGLDSDAEGAGSAADRRSHPLVAAARVMAEGDLNGDGSLSSNEFVRLARDPAALRRAGAGHLFAAIASRAFRTLDGDGDGSLTARDLAADALLAGGLLGPATGLGTARGPGPALVAVAGSARFEPGSEVVRLSPVGGEELEPGAVVVSVIATLAVARVAGAEIFVTEMQEQQQRRRRHRRLRAGQSAAAYRVVRMPAPEQILSPCGDVRADLAAAPGGGASSAGCDGAALDAPALETLADCSPFVASGDVVVVSGGVFEGAVAGTAPPPHLLCGRGLAPSRHVVEAVSDRSIALSPPLVAPAACWQPPHPSGSSANGTTGSGWAARVTGITLVRASSVVSGALLAITGPLTATSGGGSYLAPSAAISSEVSEGDTLVLVGAPLAVARAAGRDGVVLSRRFAGRAPIETRLLALSRAAPAASLLPGPSLGLAACAPGSPTLLFVDEVCSPPGNASTAAAERGGGASSSSLAPLDVVSLRGLRYTVAACAGRRVQLFAPVSVPTAAAVQVFRVGLGPAGAVLLPGLVAAEPHSDALADTAGGPVGAPLAAGRWGLRAGAEVIVGTPPPLALLLAAEGAGGAQLRLAEPFRGVAAARGSPGAPPQDPSPLSRLGLPLYRLESPAPPLLSGGGSNSSCAGVPASAAAAAVTLASARRPSLSPAQLARVDEALLRASSGASALAGDLPALPVLVAGVVSVMHAIDTQRTGTLAIDLQVL